MKSTTDNREQDHQDLALRFSRLARQTREDFKNRPWKRPLIEALENQVRTAAWLLDQNQAVARAHFSTEQVTERLGALLGEAMVPALHGDAPREDLGEGADVSLDWIGKGVEHRGVGQEGRALSLGALVHPLEGIVRAQRHHHRAAGRDHRLDRIQHPVGATYYRADRTERGVDVEKVSLGCAQPPQIGGDVIDRPLSVHPPILPSRSLTGSIEPAGW